MALEAVATAGSATEDQMHCGMTPDWIGPTSEAATAIATWALVIVTSVLFIPAARTYRLESQPALHFDIVGTAAAMADANAGAFYQFLRYCEDDDGHFVGLQGTSGQPVEGVRFSEAQWIKVRNFGRTAAASIHYKLDCQTRNDTAPQRTVVFTSIGPSDHAYLVFDPEFTRQGRLWTISQATSEDLSSGKRRKVGIFGTVSMGFGIPVE